MRFLLFCGLLSSCYVNAHSEVSNADLNPFNPSAAADFTVQAQQLAPLQTGQPNLQHAGMPWILVGIKSQSLRLYDGWGIERQQYTISTARNGPGENSDSYQTPRGWHTICQRIGDDAAPDTIIFRRKVTPSKYTPALHAQFPHKDWILTRILWLCGAEPGKNQGGMVDSYKRAIYIHGAGEHVPWGSPSSLGCVRMKSLDVIELFNATQTGIDVLIDENI
ncbi:L,D-transpeptidase [Neisseriaceae bacterium TC5R-5]|nr:L,D-transpeptidase [Neisseriaceae bacterium TC5R-5]